MQILINRAGEQYGPYTLEQVNTGLSAGFLEASDLAWHEGLPSWVALQQLDGVEIPGHALADQKALMQELAAMASETPAARPAVPILRAQGPKMKWIIAGAVAGGLVMGVGFAFLRDLGDETGPTLPKAGIAAKKSAANHNATRRDMDFYREIKPVLDAKCGKCHGPETKKGKLDLSTEATIIAGGKSGPVVVMGNPAQSPLYRRITDKQDPMPPAEEAMPLTSDEIKAIEEWILQGGLAPGGGR